jgi:hypothetical protein
MVTRTKEEESTLVTFLVVSQNDGRPRGPTNIYRLAAHNQASESVQRQLLHACVPNIFMEVRDAFICVEYLMHNIDVVHAFKIAQVPTQSKRFMTCRVLAPL